MAKRKQPLRGATKARLHSPLLKGKTRADEIAKMADDLGVPLLPWQRWLLDDMMRVDSKDMYIRKTSLYWSSETEWKVSSRTYACYLGSVLWW
jgi:hypothetical protein